MLRTIFMYLFITGSALSAKETLFSFPDTIKQYIAQKLEKERLGECDTDGLLFTEYQFFNLDKKLLVLLNIPDYMCNSNTFLPITVDYVGRWEVGSSMQGKPFLVVKDSNGVMWLSSQWQIAGTFPSLYCSKDGIDWKEVPLPQREETASNFEWLTGIWFCDSKIRLEFKSADSKEYWEGDRTDILTSKPNWIPATSFPKSKTPLLIKGEWDNSESDDNRHVILQLRDHKESITKIIIPKYLKP